MGEPSILSSRGQDNDHNSSALVRQDATDTHPSRQIQ